MKKLSILALATLLCFQFAIAQSPQSMPFQAVARDSNGVLLPNKTVSMRITIHDATTTGTIVYRDTQSVTTNNLGLLTLNIGPDTSAGYAFSAINWGSGPKFVQLEMDPTGGTSYVNMGTSQLQSVPYALYALKSGNSTLSGAPNGIPYYGSNGAGASDAHFTRNDTDYSTTVMRSKNGVLEGMYLGNFDALGNYDGAYFLRMDSIANHADLVGEFYGHSLDGDQDSVHQIGILCSDNSTGRTAYMVLQDDNPVNPTVNIGAGINGSWDGQAWYRFDTVFNGLWKNHTIVSGVLADTNMLHLVSNSVQWNWPTADGSTGQSLTTDGSGNLSWGSSGQSKSVFTPISGSTITAVWGNNIVKPSSGLAALTITLPSSPIDNETVYFTFTNTITTLSFTGGTIAGAGALSTVNSVSSGNVKYWLTYDAGSSSWY